MVIKWPPRRRRKAVDRFDRSFASKSSPNSGMVYQRQLSETEFLNGGSNMTTLHRTSNELKEKYRNDGRVCSHRFLHVSHTSRALSCIQNEWRFLDDGVWDGRGQFSYVWRSILLLSTWMVFPCAFTTRLRYQRTQIRQSFFGITPFLGGIFHA